MHVSNRIDPATVPGWGVDADPKNDPTYPIRPRENDDHSGRWARPALQDSGIEILQSIEHKRRPAVYGTASPPRGLSGMIRRGAFSYSESHWLHWLMLMGADRVDMIEGILDDLAHGKVPNIPGEMGMRAGWQHNKTGLLVKSAATLAVLGLATALIRRRKRED